jgi:DNA gyrase subunit A
MRRAVAGTPEDDEDAAAAEPVDEAAEEGGVVEIALSQERYAAMSAAEEMILTITSKGLGKRTSSHEYRITARGGQGIIAADLSPKKNDPDRAPAAVVAAWPVGDDDQVMLVTDGGQSIRCPVGDISVQSRGARGVRVLDTAGGERVVSAALIVEEGEAG